MNKIILFLALLIAAPAWAEAPTYDIDESHTRIFFRVDHAGFSDLIGEFKKYEGYFTFDAEKPEASSADITLKVNGIETSSKKLDKKLESDEFFNEKDFPKITFKSMKAVKTGENTGRLEGALTIKGITKPFALDVTYNKGAEFMGQYKVGFSATGTLKRSDFGLDKYVPTVGDDVTIEIETEGTLRDVKPKE